MVLMIMIHDTGSRNRRSMGNECVAGCNWARRLNQRDGSEDTERYEETDFTRESGWRAGACDCCLCCSKLFKQDRRSRPEKQRLRAKHRAYPPREELITTVPPDVPQRHRDGSWWFLPVPFPRRLVVAAHRTTNTNRPYSVLYFSR